MDEDKPGAKRGGDRAGLDRSGPYRGGATDSAKDFALKIAANGLQSETRYYYRFVINDTGETSGTGTFKTPPLPNVAAPLHFAFSGDNDGLMRPYALAKVIPSQRFDFY